MQKIILGIALALSVIGIASLILTPKSTTVAESANIPSTPVSAPTTVTRVSASTTSIALIPTPSPTASKSYTRADVAQHSLASSCWTVINEKIYDVTKWIEQHPGGPEAILGLCGKDGSSAFNGQHGGQPRPTSELASFYIANITQ